MTAYVICTIDVHDAEQYKQYATRAGAAVAKHGGRFIVRGGKFEVLEGEFDAQRVVVLEFPDVETVKRFYASPEYDEARQYRLAVSDFNAIVVEGYSP